MKEILEEFPGELVQERQEQLTEKLPGKFFRGTIKKTCGRTLRGIS